MTDHPDLEALSASLDGEGDGAVTGHIAACPRCRGTRARLEAARHAVAQPVLPASDVVREEAISAALAAAGSWGRDEEPAPVAAPTPAPAPPAAAPVHRVSVPPPRRWWMGGAAAAAVVAVVVGAAALIGQQPSGNSNTALSGSPPAAERAVDGAAGGSGDSGGGGAGSAPLAPTAAGGLDLGDVASVEALKARLATAQGSAAAAFGGSVNAQTAGPPTTVVPGAPVGREVGTFVCEVEARSARPQVGQVVTSANLRYQGVPAVALQFSPTVQDPVVRLLVLAPGQGCRLLAETTIP